MDMNELGYFLYMDAMEKQQKEEAPQDPFTLFDDGSDDAEEDED